MNIIDKDYLDDLKEYGRGYSYGNLKYMSQFASNFTIEEIRQQPAAQIPWRALIEWPNLQIYLH